MRLKPRSKTRCNKCKKLIRGMRSFHKKKIYCSACCKLLIHFDRIKRRAELKEERLKVLKVLSHK